MRYYLVYFLGLSLFSQLGYAGSEGQISDVEVYGAMSDDQANKPEPELLPVGYEKSVLDLVNRSMYIKISDEEAAQWATDLMLYFQTEQRQNWKKSRWLGRKIPWSRKNYVKVFKLVEGMTMQNLAREPRDDMHVLLERARVCYHPNANVDEATRNQAILVIYNAVRARYADDRFFVREAWHD